MNYKDFKLSRNDNSGIKCSTEPLDSPQNIRSLRIVSGGFLVLGSLCTNHFDCNNSFISLHIHITGIFFFHNQWTISITKLISITRLTC